MVFDWAGVFWLENKPFLCKLFQENAMSVASLKCQLDSDLRISKH